MPQKNGGVNMFYISYVLMLIIFLYVSCLARQCLGIRAGKCVKVNFRLECGGHLTTHCNSRASTEPMLVPSKLS